MEFGVLSYERKFLKMSGNESQNLGDWVQTMALESLYKEWGITDYRFISRNDAQYYDDDYVLVAFNGYNTLVDKLSYKTRTFPLSPKIVPVFFSMHFHDHNIPNAMKEQLIQFGPIGCRDEETMDNFRAHGIPAYLSGCVTALLPKRKLNKNKQNKVLFIDVPAEFKQYIPQKYADGEFLTAMFDIHRTTGEPYMSPEESKTAYQQAKKNLEYYAENAALIVTSRLHIASPCTAMGIPVIVVNNSFDGRFSWIEKYLTLYPKEEWSNINWEPKAIDYEDEKQWIKNILKNQLFSAYNKYSDLYALSSFYEKRNRISYNSIIKRALKKVCHTFQNSSLTYALWGVVENTLILNNVITKEFPNWTLDKVYDLSVTGSFEGIPIYKPDKIDAAEDTIYFVLVKRARKDVIAQLAPLNKKYIIADFSCDDWETNLF